MGKYPFFSCLVWVTLALAARPAMAQTAAPRRIALIGDSHVGNDEANALGFQLAKLAKKRGIELRYEGHNSTRASHWLNRKKWASWVPGFDPQIVIINLGTNEAMLNKGVEKNAASFQALADRLSDSGRRRIVWVMPPRLTKPKYLESVWTAIRGLRGVTLLDLSEISYPTRDGTHLRLAKYRFWAADIFDKLDL